MTMAPQSVRAQTTHVRRGALSHGFTYGVDMVLIDPESRDTPLLFSRNRLNLTSVRDADHGGPPGKGRGAVWAREVLRVLSSTHDTVADANARGRAGRARRASMRCDGSLLSSGLTPRTRSTRPRATRAHPGDQPA